MIDTLLQIIPTRALERVRPTWLPQEQSELNERLRERRERRKAYSEAQ